MADYFQYTHDDGSTTNVEMPTQTTFKCSYTSVSDKTRNFTGDLLNGAANGSLNDKTDYLVDIIPLIADAIEDAKYIRNRWDKMERDCNDWDAIWRWDDCSCCSDWCYRTQSQLKQSYYKWRDQTNAATQDLSTAQGLLIQYNSEITLNNQQAMDQAFLDQLVAETNNIISLVAYENDVREIEAKKQKTATYFAPLMVGLILIGMAIYLFKK